MTTGLKISIGIGVATVLVVGGILVYKHVLPPSSKDIDQAIAKTKDAGWDIFEDLTLELVLMIKENFSRSDLKKIGEFADLEKQQGELTPGQEAELMEILKKL